MNVVLSVDCFLCLEHNESQFKASCLLYIFTILLYKNVPLRTTSFSSVIVVDFTRLHFTVVGSSMKVSVSVCPNLEMYNLSLGKA